MPTLERMIEDLEEKKWYITQASAMIRRGGVEVDGYKLVLGHIENLEKELKFSTFETAQPTFKECVSEVWSKLI